MRALCACAVLFVISCGPAPRPGSGDDDPVSDGNCPLACSGDLRQVIDCNNMVVTECDAMSACDTSNFGCSDPCTAAVANKRSVGCDYYATDMELQASSNEYCFAAFVANTWTTPVKISVRYAGQMLNVASFARIPTGSGPGLTYAPYDATTGLPPGEVAILFLSGDTGSAPACPIAPAVPTAGRSGTYVGDSFNITTDVPVVAYQINPYGGGSVAVTAASLLLPTSVWDANYVGVNVSADSAGSPSMNIVAKSDATTVTMTPTAAVIAGAGIPGGPAGQPMTFTLNAGQHAQITQGAELTGSVITASGPIGVMAGQECMNVPVGTSFCDHGEQMIPPIQALGHRYAGVMYRPRVPAETSTIWRLIGTVDGTNLTFNPPIPGAPPTLNRGQFMTFETGTPFIVSSQGKENPFMLFTYMTGSTRFGSGYGDPDFVLGVPPEQYLKAYVFFADPTYPETNLVMIRARGPDAQFHEVTLDCLGSVQGWTAIDGDHEWARVDLITGNFVGVGACSTGRHEATSTGPFGLWVWGWGTPLTTQFTANVSYGYPGGMNVTPINNVIF